MVFSRHPEHGWVCSYCKRPAEHKKGWNRFEYGVEAFEPCSYCWKPGEIESVEIEVVRRFHG